MHPVHTDLTARVLTEERLRVAADQRRLRAARPARPALRERLGAALVHTGERLRGRSVPTVAHSARAC